MDNKITYNEFVKKYNNLPIDFDGVYGDQCMDLAHQYAVEVVGHNIPNVAGAKDEWNYIIDGYTKINNSATNIPHQGDILIWDDRIGSFGHIAVFDHGDASSFVSFDQNWPLNSKCHLQAHDYYGVIGWFSPNTPVIITPPMPTDQNYSFRQVIQFYYRIFCNIDPTEDENKNWEQKQKEGWNEIQIGQDILKNDSRAQALWHSGTNLADLTIKQLATAIVDKS